MTENQTEIPLCSLTDSTDYDGNDDDNANYKFDFDQYLNSPLFKNSVCSMFEQDVTDALYKEQVKTACIEPTAKLFGLKEFKPFLGTATIQAEYFC